MMGRKIGGIVWIRVFERFRHVGNNSRCFSTSNSKLTPELNNNGEDKADRPLTHHDAYRNLNNLDFMTAAKILFTTPPKQKKFGLDFHLVQLFFVCLPSLAVYLVAQYARHEMKKMDAELERKKQDEEKKRKAAEEEAAKANPQLLEVKERLENLEKTVNEIVVESKKQRTSKVPEKREVDKIQPARISSLDGGNALKPSKSVVEDHPGEQASSERPRALGQQETHCSYNDKGAQGGLSRDEKK